MSLTVPIPEANLTSGAPDDHLVAFLGMKRDLSKQVGRGAGAEDGAEVAVVGMLKGGKVGVGQVTAGVATTEKEGV